MKLKLPCRVVAALAGAIVAVLILFAASAIGQDAARTSTADRMSFVGGRQHESESLDCDLPGTEHIANVGSRVDGLGMCVMSSIEMSFRLSGVEEMRGLRDWCLNDEGGGWPEKVDRQIAAYCRAKGIAVPRYVQYEGPDPAPIIEAAARSGRMACITYGTSPRYPGTVYISHMVCCAKFTGKLAVVLDNNFPGETRYEWMDRDELTRRCKFPGRNGWVFVPLAAAPPASPRN